jgi:peptidoglycan/xylan/chitin deacetylase (PgdA/CDA1 family)
MTPAKLEGSLQLFAQILDRFDCDATFPITAAALNSNPTWITQQAGQNIEFAVHGYSHLDYTQLSPDQILAQLERAREVFAEAGLAPSGFRSPYLRRSPALYSAVKKAGFSYTSNEPILWDTLDGEELELSSSTGYSRALAFYDPMDANRRPALPWLRDGLVEIPVSLPDDEMLLDRLGSQASSDLLQRAWQRILRRSHELGELFTLQLHPERIALCADALSTILGEARQLTPPVWTARLARIASWWQDRMNATADLVEVADGIWQASVDGPPGISIQARNIEVLKPGQHWVGGDWQNEASACTVRSVGKPIIGLSPICPPSVDRFLHQQGFLCQTSPQHHTFAFSVDQADFGPDDERPLLSEIEASDAPLLRLGRWPGGARSALAVTGDIDALTIWDYGRRFLGR